MWALLLSGMERAEHDCPEYADGRRCLESAQSLWCGRLGSGCFDGRLKFQRFLLKSLCLATVDSPRCFGLLCPAHSPNLNRIRAHGDTSAKLRECLGYGKANRESIAIPNVFAGIARGWWHETYENRHGRRSSGRNAPLGRPSGKG